MVAVGGVLATVSTTLGSLATRAVEHGVSDADMLDATMANLAGFELVGAFLFYGVALGFMLTGVAAVRNGFTPATATAASTSDVSTYALAGGSTSIRTLLGRGRLDTVLVVGADEAALSGSTVIAVRADLHADEVKEFPDLEEKFPEELQHACYYLARASEVLLLLPSIDL